MAWRVAKSLDKLLAQLNAMYPNRSKISDGSIGDAAHASRDSDHNPWYGPGIVTARDFTHDPGKGIDGQKLATWLTTSGDKRIKYVIWNRRIWQNGWQNYYGINPHTHHVHVSVVASPACDNTADWKLGAAGSTPSAPSFVTLKKGSTGARVSRVQGLLNSRLSKGPGVKVDGVYGAATADAVKRFGAQTGVANNGEYGPRTDFMLDPPSLKRGDKGEHVKRLQHALSLPSRGGYYKGPLKSEKEGFGTYGPQTEAAVRAWQVSRGYNFGKDQGTVGPKTWTGIIKGIKAVK